MHRDRYAGLGPQELVPGDIVLGYRRLVDTHLGMLFDFDAVANGIRGIEQEAVEVEIDLEVFGTSAR